MVKKYYKVVSVDDNGNLLSSLNSFRTPYYPKEWYNKYKKWIIPYTIGKWTYPVDGTRLFAFSNLEAANSFSEHMNDLFIYECEVINPRKNPKIAFKFNDIDKYWDSRLKHKKLPKMEFKGYYFSIDSVSCSAIKLLKKIPKNE